MSSLPCPPQHWPRFSELLDAALDLPEGARGDWIGRLAGTDASLRPWLERVLAGAASLETQGFLAGAAADGFVAGQEFGPYRLVAPLGQGGMGMVWRASRLDDGPRRDVALKLPQAELLGGPFRARFRREQDVLAALSHPHIAQLYDAGVSATGHPYLALELVEGRPITEHCRASGASLDQRLDLAGQVLAALSYAHARLIVHRDIKPSNVLVTEEGSVKLLDFGIAKLLLAEDTGVIMLTGPAGRLATPGYAAPEQYGDGAVTVAADVFSAGVLLFELVTGQRPFVRVPIEPTAEAAPLASQRAHAAAIAAPEGARLRARLRGDVDAVIARALALDPTERYASAEAFARDLQCCRQGRPVVARRIGWLTMAGKFARRNRAAVGLGAVLALAVAGGTLGVAWQARRAEREAARANAAAAQAQREAARATSIKNFLVGLFEGGNANSAARHGANMSAADLLDVGAAQADRAFAGDPETEMELLDTLAYTYQSIGVDAHAEHLWQRRLDLSRSLYGPDDPRVIDSAIDLAWSYSESLHVTEALALLESIRAPILKRYGDESLQQAQWLEVHSNDLRSVNGGRTAALAEARQSVAIMDRHFRNNIEYVDPLFVLAGLQTDDEDYAGSLATLKKLHEAGDRMHSPIKPTDEVAYQLSIGINLAGLGRLAEADATFAKAASLTEKIIGRNNYYYILALDQRANMAHLQGDRGRADEMFQLAEQLSGASDRHILSPIDYGDALVREGRAADAVPLLRTALENTWARPHGEKWLRRAQGALGAAYDQIGQTAQARELLQTARDAWLQYGPPAGPSALSARERWGRFLLEHDETQAAAVELRAVANAATPFAAVALAQADLARLALAQGRPADSDAASAQAMRTLDTMPQPYDVRTRPDVWMARAETLFALGKRAEAAVLADQARQALTVYDAPDSPEIRRAMVLREGFK